MTGSFRLWAMATVLYVMAWGESYAGEVSFDFSRGLVEVPVIINDSIEATFGIDTGADRLYINRDFAADHQLPFGVGPSLRRIRTVEGSGKGRFVSLNKINFGSIDLKNLKAVAVDMGRLIGDTSRHIPDGLIGYEILRNYYITIDYLTRTLSLDTARPAFLNGRRYKAFDFKRIGHFIIVQVKINGHDPVPMAVDYCSSPTTLSPELAKSLGLKPDPGQFQKVATMDLGNGVVSRDVDVLVSDLSSLNRSRKGVAFEGILGASFLYRHKITVDYRENKLYVHRRR